MKVALLTLADHALISQEQKLSIIGIFNQFFVSNLPINWPRMYLVAVLDGEPNANYTVKLRLITPKKEDQEFTQNLTLRIGPNGKANVITELVNFPLSSAGTYKFQVLEEESKIGEFEFIVTKTSSGYRQDLKGKKL